MRENMNAAKPFHPIAELIGESFVLIEDLIGRLDRGSGRLDDVGLKEDADYGRQILCELYDLAGEHGFFKAIRAAKEKARLVRCIECGTDRDIDIDNCPACLSKSAIRLR
jgi:hypothetical protein